ncbi:c-type cytochrome [Caenimonas aquaedulcis]|uniref:C-type cytochrome n=1 Tax=Caenimonas aquaedulcis TaxID=2793270 RepID=A0A931H3G5_9BURK|nr:c-type cytochrome [Caenimonas aquaedulcis]MBG9387803.1 c-type cytochrome [Caenimonas aquaedulcis]
MKFLLAFLLAACAGAAFAAPFEDTMAQRTLACTACHGKEGRAAPDGYYPRLAGKPAGYLYNQLVNFRDNRRHYGLMTRLIDPLSDEYLMEIAQYFAALDLPYPRPTPAQVPAAVMQRGEALVRQGDTAKKIPACVQCHGDALTGAMPATPGLLGLPRDYLNSQLGAWQSGQRRAHAPDCMQQVARMLSPEDLTAVAAWLSSQPVPANAHAVAALPRTPGIACGSAALAGGAQR